MDSLDAGDTATRMKPKRKPKLLTPSERTKAWRAKNRDRYNAYMRELRAKRRAKEREK